MPVRTSLLSSQSVLSHARQKDRCVLGLLGILLIASALLALMAGPLSIPWSAIFSLSSTGVDAVDQSVMFHLRMPRVLLAVMAGGALACSGASLQTLFNNPLAEPGLIGVSSGAMIAVISGLLLLPLIPGFGVLVSTYGFITLPVLGFLGAMTLGVLVYKMASNKGSVSVTTMLLAGIAVNAFAGALAGLFIFISNDEQLRTITFWTLGSLGGASWQLVTPLAVVILISLVWLASWSREMQALQLGEREATAMGVPVEKVKSVVFFTAAVAAGTTVALTGIIGFVGLVVPHIVRSTVKLGMRTHLVSCFLVGGCFLVAADALARTLIAPTEVPVGILTSLVGTPYFFYLLQRRRVGSRA